MSEIKSATQAIDVLDTFIDELDKYAGIDSFPYGSEAFEALAFLKECDLNKHKIGIKCNPITLEYLKAHYCINCPEYRGESHDYNSGRCKMYQCLWGIQQVTGETIWRDE